MSKRLKAFLASLLVISLLVTSLSFAALSEAAPAAPAETQTIAPTEEPAIESTETPAVESTEEPVEEPTEEPTAKATEEPTEESTEEPVEEPTEEPTAEPTEAPAEEPAAELSDAQKAALENLPAGFSAGTVALAMMQSSGCEHTNLWVDENSNESQYSSINDEKHLRTYTVKSRTLECVDCGKALQTIAVNETITVERRHVWNIKSVGKKITIECSYCQKTKTISKPCSHNSFAMSEDGNLHCTQCSKQSVLNPEQTYCKHTNYTEYGTKASPLVEYQAYSKEQHVKHSETWVFSNGLGFATCDDCGIWLGLKNGKVNSVGITDFDAEDDKIESALEAHTFENGACKFCGETAPKGCDHSAGNFRDEQDKSIAPKYDNITETTHCVQYSYKRYCKDCGEYIQNVLDEGVTPVAHDFSKGNTCACGYQKQAEMKPYVRGFKMSATSVKVDGDTVRFTLDIANIKDGETVKLQFRADEWTEDFNLTAPNNVFEHKFSRAGNRQIQFRVADGEWCPAQTLKVIAEAAEVKTIRLSSTYIKEQKEGETITATVTCNNATGLVDLYVNSEYVALSSTYTEENGNRVFAISFKLGGNGKYAGEYKIRAAALKEAYASEWDNSDIVTLTVKHNYEVSGETKYEDYWEKSADGHTRYRKATMHFVCQVCNAKDERSDKYAIGSLQPHSFDENGICSECEYNSNIRKENTKIYGGVVEGKWEKKGEIRAMTQGPFGGSLISASTYTAAYWGKDNMPKNKDGSLKTNGLCNRAAASMALSYIGIDALPKEFKDGIKYIEGSDSVEGNNSFLNDKGADKTKIEKGNVTFAAFKTLFDRYNNDSKYIYSPVVIYTNYLSYYDKNYTQPKQSTHWLVVYAQDPEDSDYYWVLDSGVGRYARVRFEEENGLIFIAEYQYKTSKNGEWKTNSRYGTKVGEKNDYHTGKKVQYNMMKMIQYNIIQ